jgi:hypothetical protein
MVTLLYLLPVIKYTLMKKIQRLVHPCTYTLSKDEGHNQDRSRFFALTYCSKSKLKLRQIKIILTYYGLSKEEA